MAVFALIRQLYMTVGLIEILVIRLARHKNPHTAVGQTTHIGPLTVAFCV